MLEYAKQIEDKTRQIETLNQSIAELNESKQKLLAQCENDRIRIEDLEFQIEEHKLESNAPQNSPPGPSSKELQQQESLNDDQVRMFSNELELQRKLIDTHLDQIKVLNKQIDDQKVEIAQLKLGDEVHRSEKVDLKKKIDELSDQLSKSQHVAQECANLRETLKLVEINLEGTKKEYTKRVNDLESELNQLRDTLNLNENKKSEIEFLYQENLAKLSELTQKYDQKCQEYHTLSENQKLGDVEFILEEQKILVQDLEAKLSELTNAKQQAALNYDAQINDLNAKLVEVENKKSRIESEKDTQINKLEKSLFDLNESLAKDSNELIEKKSKEINQLKENISKLEASKKTEIIELVI